MKVPLTRGQRWRYVGYAAAVTIAALAILDGIIGSLERKGHLEVGTKEERTWMMTADPWVEKGDRFVVSPKDKQSMVPMSFSKNKGDTWRAFLLGGSFMRGVPYTGAGRIRFWLSRNLKAHFPRASIELINAAATSQNSNRVKEITRYAAKHEPDVLVVASCNNEGTLPPDILTTRLHQSDTFRLFKRWLQPEINDMDRPLHTPQDPDIDAVRANFRNNLIDMVRSGKQAGAAIYLCTLPVNLRYSGNSHGRPIEGPDHPSRVDWPRCVTEGQSLYNQQKYQTAVDTLQSCNHIEALRWTGLSRYSLGQYEHARKTLNQYLEVVPRNRCRPSFNAVIRSVAATEKVPLIDLETAVINAAPNGIPGPELFKSYCHMNWKGQALVADTILDALIKHGTHPKGPIHSPEKEDRKAIFESMKQLPQEATF